ncbi:hypothetical protein Celaphus_00012765 [Cervus elaphus hippelaphus]|uniref:Uncharacterized protein n=1 Tax=Cervus elaphus hippelaphus TaxID=46360 RepID=A0A212CJ43_CEREH|nr:hypothetical protein Celaphus_00012765 [Cervus elaphus hippelaphus]
MAQTWTEGALAESLFQSAGPLPLCWGVEVQTDYVPLLNSLAAYGWQLTCVLPTPVVRTTRGARFCWARQTAPGKQREGTVSTKQVVFLQRPCLPQKVKKKESKQLVVFRDSPWNRSGRYASSSLAACLCV